MYEKNGCYFADWRDRNGARKRKSFTSKRAALQFEQEQKELAHPKRQARAATLPRYSAPGGSGRTRPTAAKPQSPARSSLQLVTKRPKT